LDSKPFKKGKPYSVPPGVEEAPGQKCKRKDATELQDFHQWYLNVYVKHTDGRRAWQKGPTFADMDILYWEHEKEWLETLQKLRRCKIMERWKDLWLTDEDRLEESLEDPGVADDFLEPKEYAEEPEGEIPGETADHASAPEIQGAGQKKCGTLHCKLPEVNPGDRAEPTHQGLGR
jgi:condensin-2 complex subunit H2